MPDGAKAFPLLVLALVVLAPCLATAAAQQEDAGKAVQPADESVVAARVIAKTQKAPDYPPAALAARFEGTVLVTLSIGPDGKVSDVTLASSDHPNVGFEDATLKAVKKWEFIPATKDGAPVAYETSFRLSFRFEGGGGGGKVNVLAATGNTNSNQVRQTGGLKMQPPVPPATTGGKR